MHVLDIPPEILQRILPRQTLSISNLLLFPIQISTPNPLQFITQEAYISTRHPDATPEELDIFLSSTTPHPTVNWDPATEHPSGDLDKQRRQDGRLRDAFAHRMGRRANEQPRDQP